MNEPQRHEIIRRWHGGESMRAIAKAMGIARNTVKAALSQHAQDRAQGPRNPDLPAPRRARPSKLDPYEPTIDELVARYPNITATRLYEELCRHGFDGGYTIVRERLRAIRPGKDPEPVQRFETGPGVQAQVDWGVYKIAFTEEGTRRVNLFSYILSYCRRQYLHFTESQDLPTLLREHIRAFDHLGGVAATCLYDNMKTVVLGYDGSQPIFNPRFLAFATHYGFRPIPCTRGRPETKGKVERPFRYVNENLLNGRTFHSLAHLNEVTATWLAEVADVRIHREKNERPVDRHAAERPHLLPLPDAPYDTAPVVYRTVDHEGRVRYRGNGYSTPPRHIGQVLALRITETELIVYGPNLEVVGRHELCGTDVRGATVDDPAHQPHQSAEQKYAMLREQYTELGEPAVRFLEGLIEARRYGKEEARQILALRAHWRREDLIAAMAHATQFGAFSLGAIERILSARFQPKPPATDSEGVDRLPPWLTDQPVRPRQTGDYNDLLPPASPTEPPSTEDPHREHPQENDKSESSEPEQDLERGPEPGNHGENAEDDGSDGSATA